MKIGPGVFVPVVGPSGAGKDSLMAYARDKVAGNAAIRFARRVITRPADPRAEAHDTLDETGFLAAEAEGAFALSWRSHGLCYGVPVGVDRIIREGGVVVANLSRARHRCEGPLRQCDSGSGNGFARRSCSKARRARPGNSAGYR